MLLSAGGGCSSAPTVQAMGSWDRHRGPRSVLQTAPGPLAPALLVLEGLAAAGQSRDGGQGEGSPRDSHVPRAGLGGGHALPAGRDPARCGCWVLQTTGRGLVLRMGQCMVGGGWCMGALPGSPQHPPQPRGRFQQWLAARAPDGWEGGRAQRSLPAQSRAILQTLLSSLPSSPLIQRLGPRALPGPSSLPGRGLHHDPIGKAAVVGASGGTLVQGEPSRCRLCLRLLQARVSMCLLLHRCPSLQRGEAKPNLPVLSPFGAPFSARRAQGSDTDISLHIFLLCKEPTRLGKSPEGAAEMRGGLELLLQKPGSGRGGGTGRQMCTPHSPTQPCCPMSWLGHKGPSAP